MPLAELVSPSQEAMKKPLHPAHRHRFNTIKAKALPATCQSLASVHRSIPYHLPTTTTGAVLLLHRHVNAAGGASSGFSRLLLGYHLCDGLDVDLRFHHRDLSSLGEGAAAEDHEAGAARVERVVLAHAHAAARVELRAALPDDDVARHHLFSAVRSFLSEKTRPRANKSRAGWYCEWDRGVEDIM